MHGPAAKAAEVEVIKRFTGGGTVVTDQNTQFVTLIINQADLPSVLPQPRPIMQWTQKFYAPLFSRFGRFELQEQGMPIVHGHKLAWASVSYPQIPVCQRCTCRARGTKSDA